MRLAALGNQYVAEQAPWAQARRPTANVRRLILYVALRVDRQLEGAPHAVPAVLGPATARAARLRRRDRAGELSFRTVSEGDAGARRADGRLRRAGRAAGSRARSPPGRSLREPKPLFAQARPGAGRRGGARADGAPPPSRDRRARAPRRVRRAGRDRSSSVRTTAGVTRVVTVGTGIESCRAALAIADANEGVVRGARHRPAPGGDTSEAGRLDELRELLGASEGSRRRRDGARYGSPVRDTGRAAADSSTHSSSSRTSSSFRS